jgi:putative DNA primase/helicase
LSQVIPLNDATTIINDHLHLLGIENTKELPAGIELSKDLYPVSSTMRNKILKNHLNKIPAVIAKGARHNTLRDYAIVLHMVGFPDEIIDERLIDLDNERCSPPKNNADERQEIIKFVSKNPVGYHKRVRQFNPASSYLTEVSASEMFVLEIKDTCIWNNSTKKWHVWDGKCWQVDTRNIVKKRAKEFVRSLYAAAATMDDFERGKYIHDVSALNRKTSVNNIVDLASYHLTKLSGDFDSDIHLFNIQNGTLEFSKDGYTFREHRKDDLCSMIGNVVYDPDVKVSELWITHIGHILCYDDPALASNVQDILGYCLNGGNPHEYYGMWTGSGRNGKSVTLRVTSHILGTYAATTNPLTLMQDGNKQASPERIDLRGKRLIIAQEPESKAESQHKKDVAILDANFLKAISGGDIIKARELFSNTLEEFRVIGLIIFSTNELPKVSDATVAFWDRMLALHFDYIIPAEKRISHYDDVLKQNASGILNWMLAGWLRVRDKRIDRCPAIVDAINNYRQTIDPYTSFLSTLEHSEGSIKAHDLYVAYYTHETNHHRTPVSETQFGIDMRKKLNKGKRTKDGFSYIEIQFKQEQQKFATG